MSNRLVTDDGKLTGYGLLFMRWAGLHLSEARNGDPWWVYAAPDISETVANIRWATRERSVD